MLSIRLLIPSVALDAVLGYLRETAEVANVVHLGRSADGAEVLFYDVPADASSSILDEVRSRGLSKDADVVGFHLDVVESPAADRAERATPGRGPDAVVWEEVAGRIGDSAEPSTTFYWLIALATMIGAVGILTDSIPLIIGAMVAGPEFGPIAGICSAVVDRRRHLALRSLAAIATGFPLGILVAGALVVALRTAGIAPTELSPAHRSLTRFVSDPNAYSVIVALLAGVTGMLAFTRAQAAPLIGVLISVTTIPAAANVGVGLAYLDTGAMLGGAAQLVVNLTAIAVAGVTTLGVQRWLYRRRQRQIERRA